MDLQLKGKRAVVSGSSAGIGFSIAQSLSVEGADVVINGRSKARLEAAANKIRASVAKEFFKSVRPSSLLKRFASPEEVAALVTYVSSPLSSATNGAALRVDGGVVRSAF
jgi:NAD(P)-dependent dehydrogenase (short-subunit alcohol dehydrogenase family)